MVKSTSNYSPDTNCSATQLLHKIKLESVTVFDIVCCGIAGGGVGRTR